MNFRNVNSIEIPEGKVVRLSINDYIVWETPEIPETPTPGYTPIPYMTFNADKVFDTGIVFDKDKSLEIEFMRDSSNSMFLYGVRNSGNTASVTAYLSTSGAWRFGNRSKSYAISKGVKYEAYVSEYGVTINGVESEYSTVSEFTANGTLLVGTARATDGSMTAPQFIGKIYSLKIYDPEVTLLDWRPCINDYGVEGFYDAVTDSFIPIWEEEEA